MHEIFTNVTGQDDNIGDIVLRRRMLEALRPVGRLHLLVGGAEETYLDPLVHLTDVLYRTENEWRRAMHLSAKRSSTIFALKPGELSRARKRLAKDLFASLIPFPTGGSKGPIRLALGMASRTSLTPLQALPWRLYLRAFSLVAWRDVRTHRQVGIGEVMPDWAFGEGSDEPATAQARDTLVVSLRVDRPLPAPEWFAAIRTIAARRGLSVVAVCQVARDLGRTQQLAEALGGTVGPWYADDYARTERELRALYAHAALAVSDRLHVLVVAATEGCVPLCLLDRQEQKIERHFDAVGYPGSTQVMTPGATDTADKLEAQLARGPEIAEACRRARASIGAMEQRIAALVG